MSHPSTPAARRADDRAVIDAYAWHAAAANGFGDAGLGSQPWPETRVSSPLRGAATPETPLPAATSVVSLEPVRNTVAPLVASVVQSIVQLFRAAVAQWQQHRRARDTDVALSGLDDRALRDLGFDRSEISSVAAGAGGYGDPTRVRMSQALHGLVV